MKQEAGVYQKEDGYWAYRFSILVNGKRITQRRSRDENDQPFKTKRAAAKARKLAMLIAQTAPESTLPVPRKTVAEVYQEYCEKGRSGKAYATIRKQDSLWKNHIKDKFGARYVDEISPGEVMDYLSNLYYTEGRAYRYVEAFLKMFYLIFGQAYSRNYLQVDAYNKLCINKGTKIHMPPMRTDEEQEIIAFSATDLEKLDAYFLGSNAETAYYLGKYCGLRINECYGLKWSNVNLDSGEIYIDRQMQYQDGLIKLVPLKTHNAKRTLYMNEKLKVYFQKLQSARRMDEIANAAVRLQNQVIITDIDGSRISSLELVNTLPNGKMQTVNSMKYHSRVIKKQVGILFKYHFLRHTYGTVMADHNTPAHLLCNQMGHANIRTTQKYYIAMSKDGISVLKGNLERL